MRGFRRLPALARWSSTITGVLFLVLWLASGRYGLHLKDAGALGQLGWMLDAGDGTIMVAHLLRDVSPLGEPPVLSKSQGAYSLDLFAFRWWHRPGAGFFVVFPTWVPAIVAFALGGFLWRTHLRAIHRRARGLCPRCGYDLAGLEGASSCPECGSKPA